MQDIKPGQVYCQKIDAKELILFITETKVTENTNEYRHIKLSINSLDLNQIFIDNIGYSYHLDKSWTLVPATQLKYWRDKIVAVLKPHYFDVDYFQELWKTLDAEPKVKPGTIYKRDELLFCYEQKGKLYLAPDMSDSEEDYNCNINYPYWTEASSEESKQFCQQAISNIKEKIQTLQHRLSLVQNHPSVKTDEPVDKSSQKLKEFIHNWLLDKGRIFHNYYNNNCYYKVGKQLICLYYKPGGFRLGCIVGWQGEYNAQMSYEDYITVTTTQEAELVLNTLYSTLQLVDEIEQEVTK